MWCARIGFEFPFELKVADASAPTCFFLRRGDSRVYLRVLSGRGTKTTTIVPVADRPSDASRDWTKTTAVLANGEELETRTVCVSTAPIFIEEIQEIVGYTVIYVSFLLEGDCPPALDDAATNKLIDWAMEHVRQFVEGYRFTSRQVDVFMPTRHDSSVIKVEIAEKFVESGDELTGEFRDVSRQFKLDADPRNPVGKFSLPDSQKLELIRRLRSGERLHVADQLFIEAQELSRIHGDHRLALVTGGTGFETWLQWRIGDEFRTRGITRYPSTAKQSLDIEIPTKNVGPLLDKYTDHLVGGSVRASPECATWEKMAYTPRNDIVHRGRTNVTEADVLDSINAINNFRIFLENLFTKTRPGSVTPPASAGAPRRNAPPP